MGRLSNEIMIQHFSHPHPLYLSSLNQQQSLSPLNCANCTLPTTGSPVYTCKPCNFNLHVNCSQMPTLIQHPSHPPHPLSLLPVPPYPESSFACNACARQGTGFSYHCAPCGLDLHTLCASAPLSVLTAAHFHPLSLVFSPPYENRGFSCDVCGDPGGDHWLYRCASCEFDAHLDCGTQQQQQQQQPQQRTVMMSRSGSGRGMSSTGRGGGGLARKVVQGLVSVASQQIGNKFVPGYGVTTSGVGRGRGIGNGWSGNQGGGVCNAGWSGGQGGWNGNINGGGRNDQNGYGGGVNNQNGYGDGGGGAWNGYANDAGYGNGTGRGGDGGGDNGFAATVMDLGSAVLDIARSGGSDSSSENHEAYN